MPNVLSPRDLFSRPENMDETVLSSQHGVVLLEISGRDAATAYILYMYLI